MKIQIMWQGQIYKICYLIFLNVKLKGKLV